MSLFYFIVPFLIPIGLVGVFLASFSTGWEILKRGNAADTLRREIEEENQARQRGNPAA